MRNLQGHRRAVQHDDLMAPVELIGFARRKSQRHIGVRRRARMLPAPPARVTANSVVAARITKRPKLLEQPDQRQLLACRDFRIRSKQPVEISRPVPKLRPWLRLPFVRERCLARAQNAPDGIARQFQLPRDLLDRLTPVQMLPAYPRNRLHNQHPLTACWRQSRQSIQSAIRGSILDADYPKNGVTFPRRNTFKDLEHKPEARGLDHAEWLGLLLEYETTLRRQKQFEARARAAKLRHGAWRSRTLTIKIRAGSTGRVPSQSVLKLGLR
jgi:hypothetical protein